MKKPQKKYLVDFIKYDCKLDDTIADRVTKAWSYFAEIGAIINAFQFGKRKTEIGLMLRKAICVNGVLSNSAWHNLTVTYINKILDVDHHLKRL